MKSRQSIGWAYQRYIFAIEGKNCSKVTLLSLNGSVVFLYDVMVSGNTVLKRDGALGVFA